MRRRFLVFCVASLAGTCALNAADGDLLAEDTTGATFDVYSADNATYATKSAAEIAALPHVTYRVGETVTAVKWNGDETSLVVSAVSAGSTAFAPDAGGVWILTNSAQETARICVPWSVYGDSMSLTSAASPAYAADSRQNGPNRVTRRKEAPSVAYTGDNWVGDVSKVATLTFTSPSGTATTLNRTGTGAISFNFNEVGNWTVQLAMADGTIRNATITINGGFTITIQ